MSLRARVAILVAAAVVGAALAGMTAVRVVAERRFRVLVQDSDLARAEALAPVLETLYEEQGSWDDMQQVVSALVGMRGMMMGGPRERLGRVPQAARAAMVAPGSRIVVVDPQGRVVVDSAGALLGTSYPPMRASSGASLRSSAGVVGALFVGTMVDRALAPADTAFLRSIARAIAVASALSALVAIAVGLLVAGRITRPVRELTRAAERAASGDLDVRVTTAGGGEIGRLAAAFNTMAASLREQEEGRRRMIADSAHELRTPASLIQGTVEAMLDGVYRTDRATLESLHGETLRLSRLVEDLGELSLLEAGRLVLDLRATDLGDLARREAARFEKKAREGKVQLVTRVQPGDVTAVVDEARVGQVVANLLSNALRHTPSGGRVELTVEPAGRAEVSIRVDDAGPGIPEDQREKVFERYYRLDDSRSAASGGRGLGLSIARGIVRAHGGSLGAHPSNLGGASLRVLLPRVATDGEGR